MSLTTLAPESPHVTWRENALVITGIHGEDYTAAKRELAARRLLEALEATLPGMFETASVESFVAAQLVPKTLAPVVTTTPAGAATTSANPKPAAAPHGVAEFQADTSSDPTAPDSGVCVVGRSRVGA